MVDAMPSIASRLYRILQTLVEPDTTKLIAIRKGKSILVHIGLNDEKTDSSTRGAYARRLRTEPGTT